MSLEENLRDEAESALRDESVLEVLSECPGDWICSVLDRADKAARAEFSKQIRAALAFYEPDGGFLPTENALKILQVLVASRRTMLQLDLEAETRLSRKTVGIALRRLLAVEAVHFPEGPRQGVAITAKGRQFVSGTATT